MSDAAAKQIVAVVDDDEAIRPALARLIRTIGYTPRTFESAEALLQALDSFRPSCVLTDIQMPGMNGLDLTRELRGRAPHLPIILMTAYPSEANRELTPLEGVLGYMTKPLDDERLEAWLLAAIGAPPA